jgi:hypothetical protein
MSERQGDLFAASGFAAPDRAAPDAEAVTVDWQALDDAALNAALEDAGIAASLAIIAEMGRRRSAGAIPALEHKCRRFAGFGREHVVPEQKAVLDALVAIGGRDAANATARLIAAEAVWGPGLRAAVAVAARLGASLPAGRAAALLRHDDPAVRAPACRCILERAPECVPILIDLLGDLHETVRNAAACALGRLGRREGRDVLLGLLRTAPSAEVIDAVAAIADEDVIVALGRLGRDSPARYAAAVIGALDAIDHPRAARVAASLRDADLPAGEG